MNISIKDLSKVYKNGNKAISGINLEIESGMLGLLGPNGAGKTTMMRIICGIIEKSRGKIDFNKIDLNDEKTEKLQKELTMKSQERNNR